MFVINDVEINVDLFDSKKAGAFERACKKVEKAPNIMKDETLTLENKIIKACALVTNAIDEICGKGTAVKLVGEDNMQNIRICSKIWAELYKGLTQETTATGELFIADVE